MHDGCLGWDFTNFYWVYKSGTSKAVVMAIVSLQRELECALLQLPAGVRKCVFQI